MTEREDFTFRGVTPNTERRTIAVRLTLLLMLLASCLAFAPAVSAQGWHTDLKVTDLIGGIATGCGMDAPCNTQLSNPSFRFDGETYRITFVLLGLTGLDQFSVHIDPYWPDLLLVEPWKICVNSTAISLAKGKRQQNPGSFRAVSLKWSLRDTGLTWEAGDSVRLAITSGPCP